MSGGAWLDLWRGRVKSENGEGNTVVVFSIPKEDNALIGEIETLIQKDCYEHRTSKELTQYLTGSEGFLSHSRVIDVTLWTWGIESIRISFIERRVRFQSLNQVRI